MKMGAELALTKVGKRHAKSANIVNHNIDYVSGRLIDNDGV
jgi:hypothetical protein